MKTQKTVSTEPGSENTVDPDKLRDLVKSDLKVAASLCHLVQTKSSVASAVIVALEMHSDTSRAAELQVESVQKDAQLACALLSIIAETPAIFDHVVEGMVGLHNNAVARQKLVTQASEELLD